MKTQKRNKKLYTLLLLSILLASLSGCTNLKYSYWFGTQLKKDNKCMDDPEKDAADCSLESLESTPLIQNLEKLKEII